MARGDLYQRDGDNIACVQKLRFFPLEITGGDGCYLIEEGGRRLLDFSGAWGAASLGYSPHTIQKAVYDCLGSMAGASILSATNGPAVRLAEKLKQLVPGEGERRVWIGHSGSDAMETVFRTITEATGKKGIIAFEGAYHGGTAGSMAVSGHSAQENADKADGLLLLPYPNPYRPYAGDVSGDAILELLEHKLATDCPASQIAALFFEPIQADGGQIIPPPGFLAKLAEICRRHGIYLVADEVKVGVGRTGKFCAFEHEGFTPDFVAFGKGLGGGLPISMVVGPADIMDFSSAFAMQTLHGNPVCATAALAVLATIESRGLVAESADKGQYFKEKLNALADRTALIGDVRGRGLALGVELVRDGNTKEAAKVETAKLVYRAYELGLVVYYVGMHSNVLEITPPLTISRQEIDQGIDILEQALNDVMQGKVPDRAVEGFEGW